MKEESTKQTKETFSEILWRLFFSFLISHAHASLHSTLQKNSHLNLQQAPRNFSLRHGE